MNSKDLEGLKDKLPIYPGVLGRERYFNAAVLIPLVLKESEYHFVFEKRAANIRQNGEISFPGGKYDPKVDTDFANTAIRETVEELGIVQEKIEIQGRLDTLVAPVGVIDTFIALLKITNLSELNINEEEVEEVFSLPVSDFEANPPKEYYAKIVVEPSCKVDGKEIILLPARELGLPEKYSKPWSGTKHRILVYETKKGPIWGITAELINDFIKHLKA